MINLPKTIYSATVSCVGFHESAYFYTKSNAHFWIMKMLMIHTDVNPREVLKSLEETDEYNSAIPSIDSWVVEENIEE